MRVLISYLFCTRGGVETALYNRLKGVNKDEIKVDLHFFRDYGGSTLFHDYAGEVIIEADEKLIQKKIVTESYDMVISVDSADMIGILSRMGYEGKIGLEIHTTYEEGLAYLDCNITDLVDFMIVPSAYQKKLVESRTGEKNIHVLGNAVSDTMFYQRDKKERYGRKIILWVGRLDRHKNWRLFLKLAKELYSQNREYTFWVVGGLKSEQAEIDEFEAMVYRYGLECVVRWIPQVPYENMGILYSIAADSGGGYISTSMNESFGMTVIEAMICRCPVIVHKAGALPELVNDGRGLCVEEMADPGQVKLINDFLLDAGREKVMERAQKYVRDNFSNDIVGKIFCEILRNEMSEAMG